MKVLYLTNEYPPQVYGGAGVHIEFLSQNMARLADVEVRCYGDQDSHHGRLRVKGFQPRHNYPEAGKDLRSVWTTLDRDLGFVGCGVDADLVHCHTWYTHMAGIWAKLNYAIPLVLTTHSLEPLRPWKREQLGHGYEFSCWVERTALEMADGVIAVSRETRADILRCFDLRPEKIHIIHNGIDIQAFRKVTDRDLLGRFGINGDPYVLFVGRITRQKGIIHLVNALPLIDPKVQVVLCAGAPDTPEIAREMQEGVERVSAQRGNVVWIREMVDRKTVVQLYSNAGVFCCPSIYEPFGIINLEAMAAEVPVVASAVGGIPEVVVDGETGFLVPLEQMKTSPFEATDPAAFARDLASRINLLCADPVLRREMGKKGRQRVVDHFSWASIAEQTLAYYQTLIEEKQHAPA